VLQGVLTWNCALKLLDAGELICVWSVQPLHANTLDVDHCFPWAAWPSARPRGSEPKEKRDRLPSANNLREVEKRITRDGLQLEQTKFRQIDFCRGRIRIALAERQGGSY
jgi:hypothetical protein